MIASIKMDQLAGGGRVGVQQLYPAKISLLCTGSEVDRQHKHVRSVWAYSSRPRDPLKGGGAHQFQQDGVSTALSSRAVPSPHSCPPSCECQGDDSGRHVSGE